MSLFTIAKAGGGVSQEAGKFGGIYIYEMKLSYTAYIKKKGHI